MSGPAAAPLPTADTRTRIQSLAPVALLKAEQAKSTIAAYSSGLVAFSGGVDSALVLALAAEILGDKCVALTATSAAVPASELEIARRIASGLGVKHIVLPTDELSDERYASNPTNRCYFCKSTLHRTTQALKSELGLQVIFDGFNFDDRGDFRPGRQAALEAKVCSPLDVAEMTKDEVRAVALHLGLEIWNKPAAPCLASRFPYHTRISAQGLSQIEQAEAAVRRLGFEVFRVRYYGETAKLELDASEFWRLQSDSVRLALLSGVRGAGFKEVWLDVEAHRSGKMNDALR